MVELRIAQALLVLTAMLGLCVLRRTYWMPERAARNIAIVSVSTLILIGALVLPETWLALSGVGATAEVTRVDCEPGKKHHIYFKFLISGSDFSGAGDPSYGTQQCEALRPGDIGSIVYLSSYPQLSMWGSAERRLAEYGMMFAFIALLAPVFSYFGLKRQWRTG